MDVLEKEHGQRMLTVKKGRKANVPVKMFSCLSAALDSEKLELIVPDWAELGEVMFAWKGSALLSC